MIPHSRPWITAEDRHAVDTVLSGGMIAHGRGVADFENAFAEHVGSAGAVAVGSGTAALVLALRALPIERGSEAILPTYVCRDVLSSVRVAGLAPVLCDTGADWCMDPDAAARVVTPRTGVILPIHLFGIRAPLDSIRDLCPIVLEDACQAIAARTSDPAATAVHSFHATKCLTTGEGGMVTAGDAALLARMRDLRDAAKGARSALRIASPMSDLAAALGLSQLRRYEEFLSRRRAIADRYFRELEGAACRLPYEVRERSMFFRFPLRVVGDIVKLQERFARFGVHVRRGVDTLLHRSDESISARTPFPNAERAFAETLSLPIYPSLTSEEQDRVIDACHRVLEKT